MRTENEIMRDAKALYDFLSEARPAPEKADIILTAGSHDVRVADYAAKLFKAGRARLIVCSGGLGKMTEGVWDQPEAVVFANRCMALGVPEGSIVIEKASTNTGENFSLSKALLNRLQIYPKTGIIVCKPYMAKRAWATGTKQWPEVRWNVETPKLSFEEYLEIGTLPEQEISLMVGDIQRLRVYDELGYQAPVPVPDDMWDVYQRLAADGYDEYVIR